MTAKSVFADIVEFKGAPGLLKKIERLLNTVHDDADQFVDHLCLMREAFSDLIEDHYEVFPRTPLEQRQQLMSAIDNMLSRMKSTMKESISDDKWKIYASENKGKTIENEWSKLEEGIKLLRWLCTFKFEHYNESPLKFAQQNVKTLNCLQDLEEKLLKIINHFNEQLPKEFDRIFVKQRDKLQNRRCQIVLTCVGSMKATKSSFINFLLGKRICPTGSEKATARLTKIQYGEKLTVTLRSYDGEELKSVDCSDEEELYAKVVEMVKLISITERKEKCRDEVTVQLPISELKGIELWDIPGFDESKEMNERIVSILADSDIILALMPLRDGVRDTFQQFVRLGITKDQNIDQQQQTVKVCESVVCFVITCIDQFCVDNQTKKPREVVLQELFQDLESAFGMNLCESPADSHYTSSNRFVPMCTSASFNIRDHLECRDQFIQKSPKWYQIALNDLVSLRIDWMLRILQQILDFDNPRRVMQSCQWLKKEINECMNGIDSKLKLMLPQELNAMKSKVEESVQIVKDEVVAYLNGQGFISERDIEHVQNKSNLAINKAYDSCLKEIQTTIRQIISDGFVQLSLSNEFTPQIHQLLKSLILEADGFDPYEFQHGAYTSISMRALWTEIKEDAPSWIKIYSGLGALGGTALGVGTAVSEGVGVVSTFVQGVRVGLEFGAAAAVATLPAIILAYGTVTIVERFEEWRRATKIHEDASAHFTRLINGYQNSMENEIPKRVDDLLEHTRRELNGRMDERIRMIKNLDQMLSICNILEGQFNEVKRLYLDILHREFSEKYPAGCKINYGALLGKSNYEVYKGLLGNVPVAAKYLPFDQFNIHEIRYFKEVLHENIIGYYGIKKVDDFFYCIIMELCDFNLLTYFQHKRADKEQINATAIDDMLKQINTGLNKIHNAGIVHRDIKPSNVLVIEDREKCSRHVRYVISDFGLAHTIPISVVGTPGYVAPEVIDNQLGLTTNKSDIYSFGVMIQEIIDQLSTEMQDDPRIIRWKQIGEKCRKKKNGDRLSCEDIETIIRS